MRAWMIFSICAGAALGFIGFFGAEGLGGALIGGLVGVGAYGVQRFHEWRNELGSRRSDRWAERATYAAPSPERNRRILWRRSRHAKHARWILFYIVILSPFVLLGVAIVLNNPDQLETGLLFGLLVLLLYGSGIYKWIAARREVARGLELLASGVVAEARVRSLDHKEIRDSRTPVRFSLGWIITYAFRDPAGVEHSGTSGFLPRQEAELYGTGDPASVVYDPRDPSQSVWAEPCPKERSLMVPNAGSQRRSVA